MVHHFDFLVFLQHVVDINSAVLGQRYVISGTYSELTIETYSIITPLVDSISFSYRKLSAHLTLYSEDWLQETVSLTICSLQA